jgi:hypothetical protein
VAQIPVHTFTDSTAFKKFSFLNQVAREDIPVYTMPKFNVDSVIKYENELNEENK